MSYLEKLGLVCLLTIAFTLVGCMYGFFYPILWLNPVQFKALVQPKEGYMLDTAQETLQSMKFTAESSSVVVFGLDQLPSYTYTTFGDYEYWNTGQEVRKSFNFVLDQNPKASAVISFNSTDPTDILKITWTFESWSNRENLSYLDQTEQVAFLHPHSVFSLPIDELKNGQIFAELEQKTLKGNYSVSFVGQQTVNAYLTPDKNQIKSYNVFSENPEFKWNKSKGRYLLFIARSKPSFIHGTGRWDYPRQFEWDCPFIALIGIGFVVSLIFVFSFGTYKSFFRLQNYHLIPLFNIEKQGLHEKKKVTGFSFYAQDGLKSLFSFICLIMTLVFMIFFFLGNQTPQGLNPGEQTVYELSKDFSSTSLMIQGTYGDNQIFEYDELPPKELIVKKEFSTQLKFTGVFPLQSFDLGKLFEGAQVQLSLSGNQTVDGLTVGLRDQTNLNLAQGTFIISKKTNITLTIQEKYFSSPVDLFLSFNEPTPVDVQLDLNLKAVQPHYLTKSEPSCWAYPKSECVVNSKYVLIEADPDNNYPLITFIPYNLIGWASFFHSLTFFGMISFAVAAIYLFFVPNKLKAISL